MVSDTSALIALKQHDLLRGKSESERFLMCLELTLSLLNMSDNALKERFPELSEKEFFLKKIAVRYGADFARRIANGLAL